MKTIQNNRNSSALSTTSVASFKFDPNAMIKHCQYLQNYISSKAILDLQKNSDLEVQASNSLISNILEREKTIIKENVDNIIKVHDNNEQRRKEILYKRWNKNVYEPVCERLDRSLSDCNVDKMREIKRKIHQNYIDYVNKKDFVSLTDYCADEYYPYALYSRSNSSQNYKSNSNPRLQSANPTSIDENSRFEEDRCQIRCLTGSVLGRKDLQAIKLPPVSLIPSGRQGTDCISWMYMPFNQINSDVRIRSRRKIRGNFNYGTAFLSLLESKDSVHLVPSVLATPVKSS